MESRTLASWMTLMFFAFSFVACSSVKPRDTGRNGLLDRLAKDSHGNPRSQRKSPGDGEEQEASSADVERAQKMARSWGWPLHEVTVTSPFGKRGAEFHEGVDLRAKSGTPVYAAESGIIAYADQKIRGYGKMVLIRHPKGLSTVYAHNSRLLVRKGQTVKRGQKIAYSGKTGHAQGPHLHFEVREGVIAMDPAAVLPSRGRKLASEEEAPKRASSHVSRKTFPLIPPTAPDPWVASK